jgi:3-oxoacyl-[acyl-carrier-protein] synthase III
MSIFNFKSVRIESFAVNLPPIKVTSAELEARIAKLYQGMGIPKGTLEKLTGVKARHFWQEDVSPSQVATVAAHRALEQIGFDRSLIQAVFSCSITRDYFEPATACLVHHELGLPDTGLVFDISNACIGFMNGLVVLGNLIESGVVKAGLVVSGECNTRPVEHLTKYLESLDEISRDELLKLLPTLTLGSGAVAYVLSHESIASSSHRMIGAAGKAATEHCKLCAGNGDFFHFQKEGFNPIMTTEANKLITSAAKVGGRTFKEFAEKVGWQRDDIDHIFCHQVGKPINEAFYRELGLDMAKEFTIYRDYGNQTSAALPSALVIGSQEKQMKAGEKVMMLGFGSGINAMFIGIEW